MVDIDSIQPVACNVSVTLTPFVITQAVAYLCRLTEESSEGTSDSEEERERDFLTAAVRSNEREKESAGTSQFLKKILKKIHSFE